MSEVLTIDSENLILITGLVNVQTIRTCEMLDIQNIIIVRNKKQHRDVGTCRRK